MREEEKKRRTQNISGGIVAPASVYIWLCVKVGWEQSQKNKTNRTYKTDGLLTQRVKDIALQSVQAEIKPRGGNQKAFYSLLL